MIRRSPLALALVACCLPSSLVRAAEPAKPLAVLLVAGGCCHDYAVQTQLLKKGIELRIRARVDVVLNPDTSTKARFEIYEKDDWDRGYDVVIHDECSADVTDRAYVARILAAHRRGTPAVNLHCAMHSYRWGKFQEKVEPGADNAGWFAMIGLQSTGHGPQFPITVAFGEQSHPITKPLDDWTTIREELYNNIQVLPSATVLARGTQSEPRETSAVVAWVNEYGPERTRIFSTALGHNNDTVGDDRYLDLVTRGLLWAAGRLGDDGEIPAELCLDAASAP